MEVNNFPPPSISKWYCHWRHSHKDSISNMGTVSMASVQSNSNCNNSKWAWLLWPYYVNVNIWTLVAVHLYVSSHLVLLASGDGNEKKNHGVKAVENILGEFCWRKECYLSHQKQCIVTFVTMGMERRSTFTKGLHKKALINNCAMTSAALGEIFNLGHNDGQHTNMDTVLLCPFTHTCTRKI